VSTRIPAFLGLAAFATLTITTPVQAQISVPIFDNYQKPPTVLAPAHAPGMCLDFDTNKPWVNTHLWECWPGWNQAFSFKTPDNSGRSNKGQIWLGGYTCLTSQRGNGFRVTMAECNGSAEQNWTIDGKQIRDLDGRCLDANGASKGNGTWVITYSCVQGATNQQWSFSSLRAEQQKAGRSGIALAPGMASNRPAGYDRLSEFLERDRPRFISRPLTSAEKAEIQKLLAPYKSYDLLKFIHYNDRPDWGSLKVPYSSIQRLMVIAESGDKYAMDALLKVMRIALMIGDSNTGLDTYDPVEKGGPMGDDQMLAVIRLYQLTRIWAAHRWARHGPDRLAAFAFVECYPANLRCGYWYDVSDSYQGPSLYDWAETGKGKAYKNFSNIRFFPVDGGPAERLKRFTGLLHALEWTYQGRNERISEEDYAWMAAFAKSAGLERIYDNVWLTTSMRDARYWHPSERAFDLVKWKAKQQQDVQAQLAQGNLGPDQQRVLLSNAKGLGNDYLLQFAQKYPLDTVEDIDLICSLNSPDCQRQRILFQQQQERNAAFAAEIEARRQAVNAFGTGPLPNAYATVRTYDQNGNYIGNSTTTKTDAELSGGKPK
jgi:hypothetical protein